MSKHIRNISGILSHAEAKSKLTAERIDSAIKLLARQNADINFNSVASTAHVSKTTLYSNHEYRTRIESLRRNSVSDKRMVKKTVSDPGKDIIIAAKNKRIQELEAEVKRLTSVLQRYYAKDYEKI